MPSQSEYFDELVKLKALCKQTSTELEKAKADLKLRDQLIEKVFSSYLSDEIIKSLLQSNQPLQLGGEERLVTSLFSDLRDFTSLSETIAPDRVVMALNIYYAKMVDIIKKHRGTLDAFIGDAILVLFGAPEYSDDDALRAVACAVEMQMAMREVNEENKEKGLPELKMGIGINTGVVIAGNIGSPKHMKYSAIGAPVNLTARIQEFCLGGQVLISESTMNEVNEFVTVNGHLRVKLKGVKSPVTIYDIGGIGEPYNLKIDRSSGF